MKTITQSFLRFYQKEDGVTAVECALMLAIVVTICMVVITPKPHSNNNFEPTVVVVNGR